VLGPGVTLGEAPTTDMPSRGGLWLWLPTLSMLLATWVSYVDRNTLALLAPSILADTDLSAEQYGLVVSAFSIAYVLGNLVWGRLLDRHGVFLSMAVASPCGRRRRSRTPSRRG